MNECVVQKSYMLYIAGFNLTTATFIIYLIGLPVCVGFILGRWRRK